MGGQGNFGLGRQVEEDGNGAGEGEGEEATGGGECKTRVLIVGEVGEVDREPILQFDLRHYQNNIKALDEAIFRLKTGTNRRGTDMKVGVGMK